MSKALERDERTTPRQALDDAQRLDWLQLIRCDNVGPRTFQALLKRFGGARAALEALPGLASSKGERAMRLADRGAVEREYAQSLRRGVRFVALGEPDYPPLLRHIDGAPPLLAVRGRADVLKKPAVAIVGSRNASAAGLAFAERLARGVGEHGYATVSGLARGIDGAVHRASLRDGAVGVLAGGHARPYPPEHVPLIEAMVETGAVLSEMPLEWEPRGRDFPRRNRLVSGLSLATVVVEAARRSGSLITARFAAEQGREVLAVPGSPLDPRAEGPNDLLRGGVTICTRVQDVLDAVGPMARRGALHEDAAPSASWDPFEAPTAPDAFEAEPEDGEEDAADPASRIVALLGAAPAAVDDIVRLSNLAAGQVHAILLDLELDGRVERRGGNLVSLAAYR